MEKLESEPLATANSAAGEKYPQPATILVEQSSSSSLQHQEQRTEVIDVYGQEIEPICNYRTCHHKFSIHGQGAHTCKCRHPINYATGISLWPLSKLKKT